MDDALKALEQLPLSREEYDRTFRDLQEATDPFIRAICRIEAYAAPAWLLHKDGRIEKVDDGLSPEARETVRQLREAMESARQPYLKQLERGYGDGTVTGIGYYSACGAA